MSRATKDPPVSQYLLFIEPDLKLKVRLVVVVELILQDQVWCPRHWPRVW